MKQKVYKKDYFENIKMFHDVEHPKEFSTYSTGLNRHFGDKTYPKFYEKLIEHKRMATDYFKKLFEKENKIKGLKIYEESFDINKFKKSLKKLTIKELLYNKKLKNPYFERLSNSKNFLITEYIKKKPKIIKPYCPEVPEVGRYTPSYNCINKHIYEVSFSKTGLNNSIHHKHYHKQNINSEGKKYFNNIIKKFPKNLTLSEMNKYRKLTITKPSTPKKKIFSLNATKNSNIKALDDKLNMKNEEGQKIDDLYKKTNYVLNKIKNNHCLKFENYTSRKPLLKEISYNTENNVELPNYYSEKYIKGNVDFNKLSSNKYIKSYFEEISNKVKNPPLGFYQPKYNSVMNKTRDIYFSKKALPSSRRRKFKKIIYSYDVPYNYQIAPSLNKRSKNDIDESYNIKSQ